MNQFLMVHDMDLNRLGFAPVRNCAKGITPLNANVTMGPPVPGHVEPDGTASATHATPALAIMLAIVAIVAAAI